MVHRLTGFLLGGHDRDLFIKCTADAYKNLPLVDVSQGGCIMTCSHFEKAAGRELSKKCVPGCTLLRRTSHPCARAN